MNLKKKSIKSLKGKKVNNYYWHKIFNRWFKIPLSSKIIYYKNPNECNTFYFERINPNHIGLIWGKRTKRKKSNWVRIGKVILGNVHIMFINIFKQFQEGFVYVINNPEVLLCGYYIFLALILYSILLRINPIDFINIMILRRC